MWRALLKSKIHRARVTAANLHYEGSLTISADLMAAAAIVPYEQVHVLNITNGHRMVTYAIEGPAGSGVICLNGAAARHGQTGDIIIVMTYCMVEEAKVPEHHPRIVLVNEQNHIVDS